MLPLRSAAQSFLRSADTRGAIASLPASASACRQPTAACVSGAGVWPPRAAGGQGWLRACAFGWGGKSVRRGEVGRTRTGPICGAATTLALAAASRAGRTSTLRASVQRHSSVHVSKPRSFFSPTRGGVHTRLPRRRGKSCMGPKKAAATLRHARRARRARTVLLLQVADELVVLQGALGRRRRAAACGRQRESG